MTRDEIAAWACTVADEDIILADGLEDAFIGVGERCGQKIAIYNAEKCIDILISQGSSREDAIEHFEFNTLGSWVGDRTPLFLWEFPQ